MQQAQYMGGYSLTYNIWGEITDHAHGWYIDSLAKYGLLAFIPFLMVMLNTMKGLNKEKDRILASFMGLLLLVYLLHMGFDDYNFNFFVLIIMIIDGIVKQRSITQKSGKGIKIILKGQ